MKTLKGSPIRRYLNKVGKKVGSRIYVHWNYAEFVIPNEPLLKAAEIMERKYPFFKFNCLMYDFKTGEIRFDEAFDFDTADEPKLGTYIRVDENGFATLGFSESIWHHKWLWVLDDYTGFNVEKSKSRSRLWLSKLNEPAKGTMKTWTAQLKKIGLA